MDRLWLINSMLQKRDSKSAKPRSVLEKTPLPENPLSPFYFRIRDLNSQPSIGDAAEARTRPAAEVGIKITF